VRPDYADNVPLDNTMMAHQKATLKRPGPGGALARNPDRTALEGVGPYCGRETLRVSLNPLP
jgi:hypothetical protein